MKNIKVIVVTALTKTKHRLSSVRNNSKIQPFSSVKVVVSRFRNSGLFLFKHKFLAGGITFMLALLLFFGMGIYRAYFMTSDNIIETKSSVAMQTKTSPIPSANVAKLSPSPSNNPSPSESTVLGASDDSNSGSTETTVNTQISPSQSISPIPTDTPVPTDTPSDSSDTSNNSSSNSNCNTSTGVPNSWYSDVYPVSPISTSNGSVTLTVNIRDCNINDVSSSSSLKISLSSGDTNTEVNGQTLPATVSTQNGQASFSVSSQVTGTVNLTIQDTTDSFAITDTNNNSPSINFSGTSTPTPTTSSTESPTPTLTQSVSPTTDVTPTANPTPTP